MSAILQFTANLSAISGIMSILPDPIPRRPAPGAPAAQEGSGVVGAVTEDVPCTSAHRLSGTS